MYIYIYETPMPDQNETQVQYLAEFDRLYFRVFLFLD